MRRRPEKVLISSTSFLIVQAVYRGYRVRQIILSVLESARQQSNNSEDDDDDDFNYDEEVDLAAFDFDDDGNEWRPDDTPQLPPRYVGLLVHFHLQPNFCVIFERLFSISTEGTKKKVKSIKILLWRILQILKLTKVWWIHEMVNDFVTFLVFLCIVNTRKIELMQTLLHSSIYVGDRHCFIDSTLCDFTECCLFYFQIPCSSIQRVFKQPKEYGKSLDKAVSFLANFFVSVCYQIFSTHGISLSL